MILNDNINNNINYTAIKINFNYKKNYRSRRETLNIYVRLM